MKASTLKGARGATVALFIGGLMALPAYAADRYADFNALKASCSEGNENQGPDGKQGDFHVENRNRGNPVTVLAIHGGTIETHTAQIAHELAMKMNANLYVFNAHPHSTSCAGRPGSGGQMEIHGREMHITSTHFDDSRALYLVRNYPRAVSLHGMNDGASNRSICVGGASSELINRFIDHVNANRSLSLQTSSLEVINAQNDNGKCKGLGGTSLSNIVNKTQLKSGLQLEMSMGVRSDIIIAGHPMRKLVFDAIQVSMTLGPVTPPAPPPAATRQICTGGLGYEVENVQEESCLTGWTETWRYTTKQWGRVVETGRVHFPCEGNRNEGSALSDSGVRYRVTRNGNQTTTYIDNVPVLTSTCR